MLAETFDQEYGRTHLINTLHTDPQEEYGRSFMFTRPIWLQQSTQQAIWHNIIYDKHGCQKGALQVTGAYQQSMKDEAAERYFLLPCKNELLVAGDKTLDAQCRDIRAEWLNLPSDFRGKMTIDPQQTQWAIIAEYNQDLSKYIHQVPMLRFLENSWVSIELPLVGVTNSMNLRQYDVDPGTPNPQISNPPHDIIEAFRQEAWNYGKIAGPRSKIELAAIRVRMGQAFLNRDYNQLAYYTGLIFPTGSKQDPRFLFDPVTGLNGHLALNAGVNFNITLNKDITKYACCLFLNIDDIFLIRNDQCRTVGLFDNNKNTRFPKYLSRFMLFNKELIDRQAFEFQGPIRCPVTNVPGVNVLTQFVRVHPYNMVDVSLGFRFVMQDAVELELGYDIWGHGQEKITFYPPFFPFNYGIAGPEVDGMPTSAHLSTIEQQAPADVDADGNPVFMPVRIWDIDIHSPASGPALNHKAHGSFGIYYDHSNVETFWGAGFYMCFPQKNAALLNWGMWTKVGASF